jgi:hypothetical protein
MVSLPPNTQLDKALAKAASCAYPNSGERG